MGNLRQLIVPAAMAGAILIVGTFWGGSILTVVRAEVPKPRVVPEGSDAKVTVDADGAVHLPPMIVPYSRFASPQARTAFLEFQDFLTGKYAQLPAMTIAEQRQMWLDQWTPALEREKTLYPVNSNPKVIAGVYTDVITPANGIAPKNSDRVLINLHGGGFNSGARIMGALESIPVASLGRLKVIAVDYRQGPENKYPAASDDVLAVYKELLKTYKARNIGIYGCSAGGVLTAEVMARIAKEALPSPGALGIFCAFAVVWNGGDSDSLARPLMGLTPPPRISTLKPQPPASNAAYFSEADVNDALVSPLRFPAVLAHFSPTLIISSTRDYGLSPAVYLHTQLVKVGVDAELHVWEGMIHGFFTTQPDLPETREVWDVVTRFFDKHLGSKRSAE